MNVKQDKNNPEVPAKGEPTKIEQPKTAKSDQSPRRGPLWLNELFPDALQVLEYKSPSQADFIKDGVFAFDTNVLLAPFELSSKNFVAIESIYKALAGTSRLFVPAHAVREYAKNRANKITEAYREVDARISKFQDHSSLHSPMLEGIEEFEKLASVTRELRSKSKEALDLLKKLREKLTCWNWSDRVSDLYREIFNADCIVENSASPQMLSEMLERRNSIQRPPGYKDAAKEDGGVGDLIVWLTLLDIGRATNKPVVFVCNDSKADWFHRMNSAAVMPRVELLAEFYQETKNYFTIMNWAKFLELMRAPPDAVKEAASIRSEPEPFKYSPEILPSYLGKAFEKAMVALRQLTELFVEPHETKIFSQVIASDIYLIEQSSERIDTYLSSCPNLPSVLNRLVYLRDKNQRLCELLSCPSSRQTDDEGGGQSTYYIFDTEAVKAIRELLNLAVGMVSHLLTGT